MHRLIIVDRQRSNHLKIRRYVEESGLEFEVVGEYTNAEDAQNALAQATIDLVIADDALPRKNGLQIYLDNNEAYPHMHMILFTDYNRFNNTRETISDGRIDFLFKPVRRNDVVKSLIQMNNIIEDGKSRTQAQSELRQTYEDHIEVFKDRFLINLIHGHLEGDLVILDQFDYFGLKHGEDYSVGILKIDEYRKYQLALDEDEKQFLIFRALNVVTTYLDSHKIGLCFINRYDEICLLITETMSKEALFDHCYLIQEQLSELLSLRATIGLGNTYSRPSFISVSYGQARAAVKHNFYLGLGSVIHINYVAKDTDLAYYYPRDSEQQMIEHVVNGNEKAALKILHQLFQALSIVTTLQPHYFSLLVIDVLVNINRTASENNVSIENFFKDYIRLNEINEIISAQMAYDYLESTLADICKYQSKHRVTKQTELIDQIFAYVSTYYANKISLKRAAEYLGTTPSYLEKLIYQKYDKSFYDYCMFVRLSKAKELLRTTTYSTAEVANTIGFNNTEYFSAIFRQHNHMSPSQYRHQSKYDVDTQ